MCRVIFFVQFLQLIWNRLRWKDTAVVLYQNESLLLQFTWLWLWYNFTCGQYARLVFITECNHALSMHMLTKYYDLRICWLYTWVPTKQLQIVMGNTANMYCMVFMIRFCWQNICTQSADSTKIQHTTWWTRIQAHFSVWAGSSVCLYSLGNKAIIYQGPQFSVKSSNTFV